MPRRKVIANALNEQSFISSAELAFYFRSPPTSYISGCAKR